MHRRIFLLTALALVLPLADDLWAAPVNQAELLKPEPLQQQVFGDPNAPVTVIEYASLTCHHCENFHKNTWPAFKAKYIDTGKVRFVLREFPFDPLAMAGFVLARCSGDKWYAVIDLLFQTADGWAHSKTPADALAATMRQTGMSRATFDACLADRKLEASIEEVRQRAIKAFGVDATPTFFINGEKHSGALKLEQLDSIIAPMLSGKKP